MSATTPTSGQSLVWNGATSRWEPQTPAIGGDVTGLLGSLTVTQIQSRPVSSTAPAAGQSLVWNGATNRWEPQTVQNSSGTTLPGQSGNSGRLLSTDGTNLNWGAFGGDVTGPLGSTTVTQIRNRPLSFTAPTDGQSLVWNASTTNWEPQPVSLPSLQNQSGTILATSGSSAFWVPFGGDVTGAPRGLKVARLQSRPLANTAPTAGQALVWNSVANQWEPQTVQGGSGTPLPNQTGNTGKVLATDGANASWASFGGDVSGAPASMTVTQLQNRPVASNAPAAGQSLVWNSVSNRWEPQTVPGGSGSALPAQSGNSGKVLATDGANPTWSAFGGDVSGTPGSMTVTQLQSRAVSPTAPLPGQALIWNGSNLRWEPQAVPTGGGGGGGISMANQLGDLNVVRNSATSLIIGAACSSATPCNVRFGSVVYSFTSPATVTDVSGTGLAFIYVSSSGALTVGHNFNVTCSSGCTAQTGITGFPADSVPLYAWVSGNGGWDPSGATDERSFMSTKNVTAGTGIITADNVGKSVVSVDPALVGLRVAVPGTGTTSCFSGSWAANATSYYVCVAPNTWRSFAWGGTQTSGNNAIEAYLPAATCNNAMATPRFDLPTSSAPAPACKGASYRFGTLDYDDGANETATFNTRIPVGWSGTIDVGLEWLAGSSSQAVKWTIATACIASGADLLSPPFNTAQTISQTSAGTASTLTIASLVSATTTGCSEGNQLVITVGRDVTDTSTVTVSLIGVRLAL